MCWVLMMGPGGSYYFVFCDRELHVIILCQYYAGRSQCSTESSRDEAVWKTDKRDDKMATRQTTV